MLLGMEKISATSSWEISGAWLVGGCWQTDELKSICPRSVPKAKNCPGGSDTGVLLMGSMGGNGLRCCGRGSVGRYWLGGN